LLGLTLPSPKERVNKRGGALNNQILKVFSFGEDYSGVFIFIGIHECYAI
jgi:hypothetical protein